MEYYHYIIIIVIIFFIIRLICRELRCWYWKINEQRDILQSINSRLIDMNNEKTLEVLKSINSKLSAIDINMHDLKNCQYNENLSKSSLTTKNSVISSNESVPQNQKTEKISEDSSIKEGYTITNHLGRIFAMKDGKYFCPKCYTRVDELSSMCSNCGKSLAE